MEVGRQIALETWAKLYPDKGDPTESFIREYSQRVVNTIPSKRKIFDDFQIKSLWFMLGVETLSNPEESHKFIQSIAVGFRKRIEEMCLGILNEARSRKRLRYGYEEKFFQRLKYLDAVLFFKNEAVANILEQIKQVGVTYRDADQAKLLYLSRELMAVVVPNFSIEEFSGVMGREIAIHE